MGSTLVDTYMDTRTGKYLKRMAGLTGHSAIVFVNPARIPID